MKTLRALRDDETGSILPLAIFFGALGLALVLVVVAATSLYLERKRLYTVADGAALAGAEAFDLDAVTVTPDGPRVELRPDDVAAAVDDYLADAGTGRLDDVAVERATTTDGRSATVELSSSWRPPMLTLVLPKGLRLEVTAVARSVLR